MLYAIVQFNSIHVFPCFNLFTTGYTGFSWSETGFPRTPYLYLDPLLEIQCILR